MIEAIKGNKDRGYGMASVYQRAGITRQGYHLQMSREQASHQQELRVISLVKEWRKRHPKMGSRQVYYGLVQRGEELSMGINKFERLVSKYGLGVGIARRRHPLTSDGKGRASFPNLTNGLILEGINELLVSDITYFDIKGQWHYVFTLKDVYSQSIVGLSAAATLESTHLVGTLKACEVYRGSLPLKGCIHHSDNGSQYNSDVYLRALNRLQMAVSRAEGCKQNGSAEQLNHIVKNMYLNHWSIGSLKELREACKEVQYLNNYQRPIQQLGNRSPIAFEAYVAELPRKERPKKKMYDFNDLS